MPIEKWILEHYLLIKHTYQQGGVMLEQKDSPFLALGKLLTVVIETADPNLIKHRKVVEYLIGYVLHERYDEIHNDKHLQRQLRLLNGKFNDTMILPSLECPKNKMMYEKGFMLVKIALADKNMGPTYNIPFQTIEELDGLIRKAEDFMERHNYGVEGR